MKNDIFISIDTEREQPIVIGKPPEVPPPSTPEEAKEMILVDITCVTEALCRLIDIAHQNNYGELGELVDNAIVTLHSMKTEKPTEKEEPTKTSDEV